jgi:class 3 adenylate cyclase
LRSYVDLDVRDSLGSIAAPTLILHRPDANPGWPIESSRYLADRIPAANFIECAGIDALPWVGDWGSVADEIQRFMTGTVEQPRPVRRISTVLFTDIVGSTQVIAGLGDAEWRSLLRSHDDTVRSLLRAYQGTEIDASGDGFFAIFEGGASAVECAAAMTSAIKDLGLQIRAGVHTGEVELDGEAVRGIAVHIGNRIMGLAQPSEVLVSSTVRDLASGSGLRFEDAGEHELRGVPDRWRLYRVRRG